MTKLIYADIAELAAKEDVINPNLLKNSKNYEVTGPFEPKKISFGQFTSIDLSRNTDSLYLTDSQVNDGIHVNASTYFGIEKNTYYTETLWFTTDTAINPDFTNSMRFSSTTGANIAMSDVNFKNLGNNHYKVSGYFDSKNNTDVDLAYISRFVTALKVVSSIKVRFDALKLEKGQTSTDWCPSYLDYAKQSDVDELRTEIQALKSKLGS